MTKFREINHSEDLIQKIDFLSEGDLDEGLEQLLKVAMTRLTLAMQQDPDLSLKHVKALGELVSAVTKHKKDKREEIVFSSNHNTHISTEQREELLQTLFVELLEEHGENATIKLLEEARSKK